MPAPPPPPRTVRTYRGTQNFPFRLALAFLSRTPTRFTRIRTSSITAPGLADYEISLLRLLDKISNGTTIQINETGTSLFISPGLLLGTPPLTTLSHTCPTSKPIAYFILPLLLLSPFAKHPLEITLSGLTNSAHPYPSPDSLLNTTIPLLRHIGIPTPHLRILARGAPPDAGGAIQLSIPLLKSPPPPLILHETPPPRIARIRGVAYTARVPPALANALVDEVKSTLKNLTPDIYITTDHAPRSRAGTSPGFGIALVAETTSGSLLGADANSSGLSLNPEKSNNNNNNNDSDEDDDAHNSTTPHQVAANAVNRLLQEIADEGAVDTPNQQIALWFMALAAEHRWSKIRFGRLSHRTVCALRDIRDVLGVVFKVEAEHAERSQVYTANTVTLSCAGVGLVNMARQSF